ncbi:hypothetical protein NKR23_g12105 [Pleurostoma richardsiae]|uniref:F-box domain-containing protein n=1 Tax=Pleurostoma richardsiae TaxID=41990 RepID=A0AA38R8U6_9PEZI|nr:hypothetical protein NKR23_g12105 [Pleurostoma richardsiae]
MDFSGPLPIRYVCNLPADIMLAIVEKADWATLWRLTQTSKAMRNLIASHERSITVTKLSRFPLPPIGAVLSSETEQRESINAFTFGTVTEFNRRDWRIDSILSGGFLSTGDPTSLGLSSDALCNMKRGLKRALYIADRVADVEADVMLSAKEATKATPSRKPDMRADVPLISRDQLGPAVHGIRSVLAWQSDLLRICCTTRARQIMMIRTLSTEDLAFLNQLTSLAAMGYARYKAMELRSDPGAWDKVVAFREMLLRHGSLFLWAYVRGSGSLHRFMESMVRCGVSEIREWEDRVAETDGSNDDDDEGGSAAMRQMDGAETWLPGLHMTMVGELRSRLACKVDVFGVDDVWTKSEELVCRIIGHQIRFAAEDAV